MSIKNPEKLKVSIPFCSIVRLIKGEHEADEVLGLLTEMECVGVKQGFSMVEKAMSLYWQKMEIMENRERVETSIIAKGGQLDNRSKQKSFLIRQFY